MNGPLDLVDAGMDALASLARVTTRLVPAGRGTLRVYEAQGEGTLPALVLLHGLAAGSAAQFVPWLLLGRRSFRRVIALDLPGHGRSPPLPVMNTPALYDAVVAALDGILDEPPVVYGNSLGGAVALHFGLVRPARGLVLASPAGTPLREELLEALLSRMRVGSADAARALLSELEGAPAACARLVAEDVRARFSRAHIRALVDSVRNEHGFTPRMLQSLQTPTLVLWGATDRLLPPEMLVYYRTWLPARFERPPGVGHVPHVEAPLATWRRLVRFAEEVSGRTTGAVSGASRPTP
jgi:pimeloyl-ACP methyl ester carboxylesterase